jgi:hypothetical protein
MSRIQRPPCETYEQAELRREREALANTRRAENFARGALTHWLFWQFCPSRRCRRAHACRGDVNGCFERFSGVVGEEAKVELRANIFARQRGFSPEETAHYVGAELAHHRELEARRAQDDANPPRAG